MRIASGTYVGNGTQVKVTLGFRPGSVIVFSPGKRSLWYNKEAWCERSNSLDAQLSMKLGVTINGSDFYIGGGDPQLAATQNPNTTGVTYYWLAFGLGSGETSWEAQNYFGNAVSGRVVELAKQAQPSALFIKRDTAAGGVVRALSSSLTALTDGTGSSSTAYILGMTTGSFTVDASNNVNQLSGGLGEATQVNAFFNGESANLKTITWTGDGTAGQALTPGVGSIQGALLWREDGSIPVRLKTPAMATDTTVGALSTGTANAGEATISTATLTVAGALNATGVVYFAQVFGADDGAAQPDPVEVPTCSPGSGRKVMVFPGRAISSYVDCGVGSSSLVMAANAPNSFEMLVSTAYMNQQANTVSGNFDNCPIFVRSDGNYATAGTVSWLWFLIGHLEDGGGDQGLSGACHVIATTTFMPFLTQVPPTYAGQQYRTGLCEEFGHAFVHLLVTHNGAGKWKVYRNGRLWKQRNVDMRTNTAANNGSFSANLTGNAAHRTMFGARWSTAGGGVQGPFCRMKLAMARVYNVELTGAQVLARYQRAGQGSTVAADVTPLEEWDAANVTGTTLAATINAANNGTLTNVTVATL